MSQNAGLHALCDKLLADFLPRGAARLDRRKRNCALGANALVVVDTTNWNMGLTLRQSRKYKPDKQTYYEQQTKRI